MLGKSEKELRRLHHTLLQFHSALCLQDEKVNRKNAVSHIKDENQSNQYELLDICVFLLVILLMEEVLPTLKEVGYMIILVLFPLLGAM